MTEELFEEEMRFYRQSILEAVAHVDPRFSWKTEVPAVYARFESLAREDFARFRQVCITLLEDGHCGVRLGCLKLLSSCSDSNLHDDTLSMAVLQIAIKQQDLREEALSALWKVRTQKVLPAIFLFAERGYSSPLSLLRRMIRTPEEIERALAIARKYIDAPEYRLREAALFLLQQYSSMEKEAERVLATVQKYTDELFIDALKKAPVEGVLEALKEVRSTIEEKYVEYGYLSSTIQVLEQKKRNAEADGRSNI